MVVPIVDTSVSRSVLKLFFFASAYISVLHPIFHAQHFGVEHLSVGRTYNNLGIASRNSGELLFEIALCEWTGGSMGNFAWENRLNALGPEKGFFVLLSLCEPPLLSHSVDVT